MIDLALGAALALGPHVVQEPSPGTCSASATLTLAGFGCHVPSHGATGTTGVSATGPTVVSVEQSCTDTPVGPCSLDYCANAATQQMGPKMVETLSDGSTRTYCDFPADGAAPAAPQVTEGQVLTAMRRLSWPASELKIQPVKGRTLVNFRTNFFTTNTEPTRRRVRLLGQAITIEATPSYHWVFGDGSTQDTSTPGAAFPALLVTHEYLRKGVVQPRLDTIYAGRYRLGDGPWRPISGTVTVPGSPQRLEVVTASPVLVGYE